MPPVADPDPLAPLLARMGARDMAAFRALYEATLPRLRGLARRVMADIDLADDVLQLAYVRVWDRAADYDPRRGAAMGWLLRLCRNVALDELRRRRAEAVRERRHAESTTAVELQPYRPTLFAEMITPLEVADRVLLTAIYVEGWTHIEAAERQGVPAGTAKSRIRRAVAKLRRLETEEP